MGYLLFRDFITLWFITINFYLREFQIVLLVSTNDNRERASDHWSFEDNFDLVVNLFFSSNIQIFKSSSLPISIYISGRQGWRTFHSSCYLIASVRRQHRQLELPQLCPSRQGSCPPRWGRRCCHQLGKHQSQVEEYQLHPPLHLQQ